MMAKRWVMVGMAWGLAAGPAWADSTISYELALGGDNQASTYEAGTSNYPCFDTTNEVTTDTETYDPNAVTEVTWSVYVAV